MVHESRDESENATDLMRSAPAGQLTMSRGPRSRPSRPGTSRRSRTRGAQTEAPRGLGIAGPAEQSALTMRRRLSLSRRWMPRSAEGQARGASCRRSSAAS
jgi:hypothetical protein